LVDNIFPQQEFSKKNSLMAKGHKRRDKRLPSVRIRPTENTSYSIVSLTYDV